MADRPHRTLSEAYGRGVGTNPTDLQATPGKNERVVKYRTKRNGEVRVVQVREPGEVRRRGARRQG